MIGREVLLKDVLDIVSGVCEREIEAEETWLFKGSQVEEKLENMGMSSLEFIEFIVQVEDKYDLSITGEDAVNIRTLRDMIDYIEEALS